MQAFLRIDDKPIRMRTQVYDPDYVIVLDPTLIGMVNVSQGVKKGIIINSKLPPSSFKFKVPVHTVDVTKIALEILGRNITNTGMVAAFAKVTGMVKLESIEKAIDENFKDKLAEANKTLVRRVYEQTKKA